MCDSVQDCPDGSDESERACQTTGLCSNSFRCSNGKCIDKSLECNAEDNCGDNSDEFNCDLPPCNFGACSQECLVKHHHLTNFTGKVSSVNSKRISTSASCFCADGYVLEAKKVCKSIGQNASLLLANENILRTINPYAYHKMVELHPEHSLKSSSSILKDNFMPKIVSIDVYYEDSVPVAVWSVKEERVIYYQKMPKM